MEEEKNYQTCHTFSGYAQYLEIIQPNEIPQAINWGLPSLYKHDVHNNLRVWQVGFNGGEYLQMSHGIVDGEIRTDCCKVEVNTSGRNIQQQALLEASHRYQYKCNHGYASIHQQNNVKRLKPMLANKLDKQKLTYPIITNPKIDGIRMLVCLEHGKIIKYSRGGIDRVNMNHLDNVLFNLLNMLPPGSTLDGEIYKNGLSYNNIESLAQSGWLKGKEHLVKENSIILDYWIFDLHLASHSSASFVDRWNYLTNIYNELNTRLMVNQLYLTPVNYANSREEIEYQHNMYISYEYEGSMLRKCDAPYKEGRSNNLIKYKNYDTDEAIVLMVEEGSGTQENVAYLWVQDRYGNKFRINFKETISVKKQWLLQPQLVIGKILTFKYQGYQKDNKVPRFPVGIRWRDVM